MSAPEDAVARAHQLRQLLSGFSANEIQEALAQRPSAQPPAPPPPLAPSPSAHPPATRKKRRSDNGADEGAGSAGSSGGEARGEEESSDDDDEGAYDTESDSDDEGPGSERWPVPHSAGQAQLSSNEERLVEGIVQLLLFVPTLRSEAWGGAFVRDYVEDAVRKVRAGQREAQGERLARNIFAGGVTQSNKTLWKLMMIVTCHRLGVPTFLASTFVQGTKSLTAKLRCFLKHIPEDQRPPIIFIGEDMPSEGNAQGGLKRRRVTRDERVKEVCMRHGCVVVNDTCRALQKARDVYYRRYGELAHKAPGRRRGDFVLILDEADAFQRSQNETIKLEKALKELVELRPYLSLSVSATLLPVFAKHARDCNPAKETRPAVFFTKTPPQEYNSCNDLEPLYLDGDKDNPIFLDPKDLTPSNAYMNDKTDLFVRDALAKPRSCSLIICTPRVEAEGGLYHQVKRVRSLAQEMKRLAIVVAVSGKCVKVFPPVGEPYIPSKHCTDGSANTVSKIMTDLDDKYGLDTPMIIVGYSQMIRGDSFRSDLRVPTHIIPALGPSMSIDKMVQSAGRATYMGKPTLIANGFEKVKILTYATDYQSMKAYRPLMDAIRGKLRAGLKLSEIMNGDHIFPAESNIRAFQSRPTGNLNERHKAPLRFSPFDQASLGEGHKYILKRKAQCTLLQKEILEIANRPDFVEQQYKEPGEPGGGGGTAADFRGQLVHPRGQHDADLLTMKHVAFNLNELHKGGFLRKATSLVSVSGKRVRIDPVFFKAPDGLNPIDMGGEPGCDRPDW